MIKQWSQNLVYHTSSKFSGWKKQQQIMLELNLINLVYKTLWIIFKSQETVDRGINSLKLSYLFG